MFLFSFLFSNVTFALFCCKQNNQNNSFLFPFASLIWELLHIITKKSFLASLVVAWITGSVCGCINRTLGAEGHWVLLKVLPASLVICRDELLT